MKRAIAIVIFPVVEELDFVGPWEVFSFLRSLEPAACDVFTVSEHGGEVRCAKGLRVVADHSFETAPTADIVLVPGGMGTRAEVDNPRVIDYLRRAGGQAEIATSVCTGAFLLAERGLLDGRRATTHWASVDWMRGQYPAVTMLADARVVDEGRIVTSAGVSAGIDMALHVVARLHGEETAAWTARRTEYDWRGRAAVVGATDGATDD